MNWNWDLFFDSKFINTESFKKKALKKHVCLVENMCYIFKIVSFVSQW